MEIADYSPLTYERPVQSITGGIPMGKLLCSNRPLLGLLFLGLALTSIFCFIEVKTWTEISDVEARANAMVQEADQLSKVAKMQLRASNAEWWQLRKKKKELLAASQQQNVSQGLLDTQYNALDDLKTALDEEDAAAQADQQLLDEQANKLQLEQVEFWADQNDTIAALEAEQDAVDQLYAIDKEQETSLNEEKALVKQLADAENNLTSVKEEVEKENEQQAKEELETQEQLERDQSQQTNQELLSRAKSLQAQKSSLDQRQAVMTDEEKALCEEEVKLHKWKRAHPDLWARAGAEGDEGAVIEAVSPECAFKMDGQTIVVPPDELINVLKGALDQLGVMPEASDPLDGAGDQHG